MSMTAPLVLLFFAAPPPPEVTAHNRAAMAHYLRGDFEAAYTEFCAVYAALPDPARDRRAREDAMGSIRSALRKLHAADPRTPEPLCRLATHLRGHIAALTEAHPGQPDLLEIRGNQELLATVTHDLAPYGPTACDPPSERSPAKKPADDPGPTSATPPPERRSPPPPTDAAAPTAGTPPAADPGPKPARRDSADPRHLKIAGGVALGLAGAALGIMAWRIADEAALNDDIDALERAAAGRPFTPDERDALGDLRGHARSSRWQALGVGFAGVGLAAIGTALLVVGHRAARTHRTAAAPMWLPGGAGLTVHVRLGARASKRGARR